MATHVAALQDHVNALHNEVHHIRAHLASGASSPLAQPPPHVSRRTPIDPSLRSPSFPTHPPSFSAIHGSPDAPMAPMSPSNSRPKSNAPPPQPTFRGPTSNDFNFGVAKSSLKTMGITALNDGAIDGSGGAGTGTREASPTANSPPSAQLVQTFHRDKDPIWSVSQDEALRLCDVFEDEMGLMYPVLDIESVKIYAKKLYAFMEAAQRTGLMQHGLPGDALDDEDTSILKLVLATGMVTEDGGRNELGKRMFERVQPSLDNLLMEKGTVKGIRMLATAVSLRLYPTWKFC